MADRRGSILSRKSLERTGWANQLEFFFSCVGYAVGLGNIWRFPYLAFQYGGGAFMIPYVIMLVVCGLPLFFLELAFGQFGSRGPITIWRICPLFTGVGIAMVLISFMVCLYYNIIITYGIYYCLASIVSLDGALPWASCGNPWNTKFCITERPDISYMSESAAVNMTLERMDSLCISQKLFENNFSMTSSQITYNYTRSVLWECDRAVLPSEEYFTRHVLRLHEAENVANPGGISIKLLALLAFAWLIQFMTLRRGVETSGKIVYFLASFPYIVLVALLARGVTLEGYMKGIEFYMIPKWEKLNNINVWREAATQIFYSLGPAFGTLITIASYNPFRHNCYRDAVLVAVINCSTSVFAGFVIFSMLGYMAHVTNQDVQNVTSSGPGLVFIVYPEGIARMPLAPVWAFLFFIMLIFLGLDSQLAMFETVISAIIDEFPQKLRGRRVMFTAVCHLFGFLLGIPMVTYGGIWVLTILNYYCASYALMITCLCELVAINYFYGNKNFCSDIEMMLGFTPNWYWRSCWMVLTPLAIVIMLVLSGVQYTPAEYGGYQFEPWAQGFGFATVGLPMLSILLGALYQIYRHGGIWSAIRPHPLWGPAEKFDRTGKYAASNEGFRGDSELHDITVYPSPQSERVVCADRNGI